MNQRHARLMTCDRIGGFLKNLKKKTHDLFAHMITIYLYCALFSFPNFYTSLTPFLTKLIADSHVIVYQHFFIKWKPIHPH